MRLSDNVTVPVDTVPANDNIANATDLGTVASVSVAGNNRRATLEAFEDDDISSSVWWKWTAPATNLVEIDTFGSEIDTDLEISTDGTRATRIRHSDKANPTDQSRVAFFPTAGTTYFIRVATDDQDDEGNIQLHLQTHTAPSTAAAYVRRGRAFLEEQNDSALVQADAMFQAALGLDSNHKEANLLRAMTRFALLEQGPAFASALAGLGVLDSSLYERRYDLPRDAENEPIGTSGTNTQAGFDYLVAQVRPAVNDVRSTYLAKVTGASFATSLSDSETSERFVRIDSGDVSLLRATTYAIDAMIYLLQTYDAAFSVSEAVNLKRGGQFNVGKVLDSAASLLRFTTSDKRSEFKSRVKSTNTFYQTGSTYIRTKRANPMDRDFLFPLKPTNDGTELEVRKALANSSASLDGPINWDGETVNASRLLTSRQSLRHFLPAVTENRAHAGSVPDPTFDGVMPTGTHAKLNDFLDRHDLLLNMAVFAKWIDTFLPNQPAALKAPKADADGDTISNFLEFAFNLNPAEMSDSHEFMVSELKRDTIDGQDYLELTFVRRIDTAQIRYIVAVSDDLKNWDLTESQVELVGMPVPLEDGVTEEVTYRLRANASLLACKFLCLRVTEVTK